MSTGFLFYVLLPIVVYCYSSSLCDGTEYAYTVYDKLINDSSFTERYDIQKGVFSWWHNVSYWGANPSGIYGSYVIPSHGKYATENGIFLRSSDAIIFAGCTPPIARYFSWTEYLFYRYFNLTNSSFLFASLGDVLNNLVINTSNINTSNSFNALTTIITTGDQRTFYDIYSILNSSQNDINLRSIPSKYFNFLPYNIEWNKYNNTFDTFQPLIRLTIPLNQTLYKQYININQTVYYITFKNASNKEHKPRISFVNQTRNTYSYQNINFESFEQSEPQYGFSCIQQNTHCLGDTRDTQYWHYNAKANLINNKNNIFVVLGVNSFNVNLAAYQNFCYYIHTANDTNTKQVASQSID
eukprot:156645_1